MELSSFVIWLNTALANFDEAGAIFVHNLFYPWNSVSQPLLEFVSFLGHDGIPLIIFSFILILFRKTRRIGTPMLLGLGVGAVITNLVLKILIARPRPYTFDGSIYYQYWQMMGSHLESDKSFPSGHVTAAFDSMVPVILVGKKKIRWLVLIFCFLMCFSRIYLSVHYTTDVIAGIFVGTLSGILGTLIAVNMPDGHYDADIRELARRGEKNEIAKEGKHVRK